MKNGMWKEVEEGVAGERWKWESRQLQAFLSGGFDYLELGGKGRAGGCGGGVDVLGRHRSFQGRGQRRKGAGLARGQGWLVGTWRTV